MQFTFWVNILIFKANFITANWLVLGNEIVLWFLPPMQAPNAKDHTKGCKGKPSSRFCARLVAILTIIVVSGTLSTKALANADTQSSNSIATANRDSSLTDRMIFSVCSPIHSMKPRRESAWRIFKYISVQRDLLYNSRKRTLKFQQVWNGYHLYITSMRINSDAKNNKVLHSTRAIRPSKSLLSANIKSNRTPIKAVQPKDKFNWGTLCRKKSVITKISTNPDFVSNHLSLIGYCSRKNSFMKKGAQLLLQPVQWQDNAIFGIQWWHMMRVVSPGSPFLAVRQV